MRKRVFFINAVIGLCLCAAHFVLARTSAQRKFSPEADQKADHLRTAIQGEITGLGEHPWAGDYYQGDGLGVNVQLLIAPQCGYLFEWHGCLGLYDRNYGCVKQEDGIICLSFTYPNDQEGFQGIADKFIPVVWGQRKYLIPSDKMIDFCNSVNSKSEPRQEIHGRHLLRAGDELKPVKGDPDIPEEYKKYLLKEPVTAEIVSVDKVETRPFAGGGEFQETLVTLNKGISAGLLNGMELYIDDPNYCVGSVVLQEVNPHESKGIMRQFVEEKQMPQVGSKFSTLPHWRAVDAAG